MKINNLPIANDQRLTVFGGVNVIESDDLLFRVAEEFKSVAEKYKFSKKKPCLKRLDRKYFIFIC